MSDIALKVENLYKRYRLGAVDRHAFKEDVISWWAKMQGKPDPYEQYITSNDLAAIQDSEEMKKLKARYVWALQDINFEIKKGEIVGIIGKNGAGKSTLLKILSKTTTPTKGQVKINGRIASLLEVGTGFHGDLTGRENIYLNGAILGMTRHEIKKHLDEIVAFAGVDAYIDTPVKRYSSGMYVRLAFAVGAHLLSDILIVDEVLAVGDAEFQKKCIGKMKDVSTGEGKTVLFVSHNMTSVQKLCEGGLFLKNGAVDLFGKIADCIERYNSTINQDEKNILQKVIIDDSFRVYQDMQRRIASFISIEFCNKHSNNLFSSSEELSLVITIKSIKKLENFRIAIGINSIDDTPVGLSFSQETLHIKEQEELIVVLTLKNHYLAKGSYYINLSLGIGNQNSVTLVDYDTVVKVLFFEIAYSDTAKKDLISTWSRGWGYINFQPAEVKQLNF